MQVIDCSSNNGGNMPWMTLRDQHGIGGGIVKLTQSDNYVNPDAARDRRMLHALGMERGGYHYADPAVSAALQIAHHVKVANAFGGYGPGEPVFVDFESSGGYDDAQCKAWLLEAEDALDKLEAKQPVGVYGPDWFLVDVLGINVSPWNDYLAWVASWGTDPTVKNWYGWQYTDSFAGSYDCSLFPRGLTQRPIPTAATGGMTHSAWLIALQFVHEHFAQRLWGEVWTKLTKDPAETYKLLVEHKLIGVIATEEN